MAKRPAATTTATAGYSGTPLARKLGINDNCRLFLHDVPADYTAWTAPLPPGVTIDLQASEATDIAHVFVTEREALGRQLVLLRDALRSDAALWVSWPKKASKLPTTITEDSIRELALPLGFVDVKVCAVSEVWSGLKLMVRKTLR